MADEQSNPLPQQAIPPKAVPPTAARPPDSSTAEGESPTVRRQVVATGSVAPSSAPRTVRLRPVAVPGNMQQPASAPAPSAAPSGASNAVEAAIKRMTAQIPLAAGDISAQARAPNKRMTSQIPLPTIETLSQGHVTPIAATPAKGTSRIPLPTAPISMAVDAPKTIKIQPLAGITPPHATQPTSSTTLVGEALPQQASKSKTSRIPLEAAMGVSPSTEANAPRTIKLKRPGDMSAVKVAVPGAQAGTPTETDTSAITQRKTIRVKRPMAPTAATGEEAEATAEAAAAAQASERMTAIQAAAPARHAAPFMVAAALCVVIIIGLLLVFAAQIFGPNASLTQLSIWPGIDIPLPGSVQVES